MAWSLNIDDVKCGGNQIRIMFSVSHDGNNKFSGEIGLNPSDIENNTTAEIRQSLRNRILDMARNYIATDNLKTKMITLIGYTETIA